MSSLRFPLFAALSLLCVASLGCCVVSVNGDGGDSTGAAGTGTTALIAGLASLRVSAQLQGGSSPVPLPPTTQVLIDSDLRNSLSNSTFSASVPVSQDALLTAVVFEVEFLNPQSSMSIQLSSPDLPQDSMTTMLLNMATVMHTDPVPPSVRHTYTMYLMLLSPMLLGIRPSSDVVPITLQFTLSVAATADPSVHREYGVSVVSLIQPNPMFQPTRVLSIGASSAPQPIKIVPSYNSSWTSSVTFSNQTAPLLVVSRDPISRTAPPDASVDRAVSVWQQIFDVFLTNSVSGRAVTTATSSNSSVILRFNVTAQVRVPIPSVWLPMLPIQADVADTASNLLQVAGIASRCASDVGDASNSSTLRMGVTPVTLQWDSDAILAGLAADPNPNPTTALLQTIPVPLEIELNLPAGNRTFNIVRCTALTFNLTNLTHTQAYRLEWSTQVHMTDLDQRVAATTTTPQQSSSSGTSANINLSSTGSVNVATTTASSNDSNGAGNETDGGSTTLGVFSGLAVFALAGYRIWLDYKDRRANQLLRSIEQPHAGSQL